MIRTLKTITHNGHLAVEYCRDGDQVAIIVTNRPLITMAELIKILENNIQDITCIKTAIVYNNDNPVEVQNGR